MRPYVVGLLLIALLWSSAPRAQTALDLQQKIDVMVRLCVAGGQRFSVSGGGSGGAEISLRAFDAKGNLKGDFHIDRSQAEGLVNGIDNAISEVAAIEIDKVRERLRPVRERVMDILFPAPAGQREGSAMSSDGKRDQGLTLGSNFYVSFSFPKPGGMTGKEAKIVLRFINNQENFISIENISVVELFGNDKHQFEQFDECYDPQTVEFKRTDDINEDDPIRGARATKNLYLVSYKRPTSIMLNGNSVNFPLDIPPKQPVVVIVTFEVNLSETDRAASNFFVICPTIKFFDTRGQESVAICPGLLDMIVTKEEYSADAYLFPRQIAHRDHIMTIGPSPQSGDTYRVLAGRAGWFQLTPKMGANSCPLVSAD